MLAAALILASNLIVVDAPPEQVGPGDVTSCGPSVAKWHDLLITSQTLLEGLLGPDNPNIGIYFTQTVPNGPWAIWMVKQDGSACPLISGPTSKTLRGDGRSLHDFPEDSKE